MYDFEFLRPATLAEAVEALADEDAQPLAGGQTLIPTLRARLAMPGTLVSLTGIAELKGIAREGDALTIGAATTHAEIARMSDFPALASLAARIGDPHVRNRGTIGGSIANNDPAACYPAAALATGASIVTDRREVAAGDFFVDLFETALEEGEIVTAIRFPIPDRAAYEKFRQPASRFPIAGVFVAVYGDAARVAVTGASESGVFRWSAAEEALSGNAVAAALDGLTLPAEGLMGDIHAAPDYRAHLVAVMARRAVEAL